MSWIDSACSNVISNNKHNNNSNNNNNNNGDNHNSNHNSGHDNHNNDDKEIALELLTISKSDIWGLAKVITEITNPQLREILRLQLTNSINEHYALSDIAVSKQWYTAFTDPEQQLQQDTNKIENLS